MQRATPPGEAAVVHTVDLIGVIKTTDANGPRGTKHLRKAMENCVSDRGVTVSASMHAQQQQRR